MIPQPNVTVSDIARLTFLNSTGEGLFMLSVLMFINAATNVYLNN